MTPLDVSRNVPQFPTRSRLLIIRDLAMIGVCVALIAGFIAHAWTLPPPEHFRPQSATAMLDRHA